MFFGYPTIIGAAILLSSGIPMDFNSSGLTVARTGSKTAFRDDFLYDL